MLCIILVFQSFIIAVIDEKFTVFSNLFLESNILPEEAFHLFFIAEYANVHCIKCNMDFAEQVINCSCVVVYIISDVCRKIIISLVASVGSLLILFNSIIGLDCNGILVVLLMFFLENDPFYHHLINSIHNDSDMLH